MAEEEKITETKETFDSFEEYFSEETKEDKNKKQKGPDILAVSSDENDGMVIKEVVKVEDEENTENTESTQNTEENEEKPSIFPNAQKIINKRTHKNMAFIGTVAIILAIIGSVTFISGLIRMTDRVIHNTAVKEELEWKIYPLLMLDPATFDDPSTLDPDVLLKSCLWQAVLENRKSYEYDENMMLLVPASDLDVAAKKLYGENVLLNHRTFSDGYELFYLYDEENKMYQVPVSDQSAGYTPKIVKIKKTNDYYTVIAGYVPPTSLWNMSEDGVAAEEIPTKYLYYDLLKLGYKSYIILSVRDIPAEELPDDLETSSQQSLNQTHYVDYSKLYEEYMQGEGMEEGENIPDSEEIASSGEEAGTSSSEAA